MSVKFGIDQVALSPRGETTYPVEYLANMMTTAFSNMRLVVTPLLLFLLTASVAYGQAENTPDVHWAYASFFGTGWYKVSDTREAFVIKASPRWSVGEPGYDDAGDRVFGYTLRAPLTLGLTRFGLDDISSIIDPGNLSTLSAGLVAEMDIPVNERFFIRPIAEIGYGTVLGENNSAWTWRAEARSRYSFLAGKLDWSLLTSIGITGYEPNIGDSDNFSYASLFAEFAYPVKWMTTQDSQKMLYWHLGYMAFVDDIEFSTGTVQADSVGNYWQFGLAMGKRDKPIKVWFMKFDRLGLAYKYGDKGRLRGINIIFRSLYDF